MQIEKTWNGNLSTGHKPYLVIEARSNKGLAIGIDAPFYDDVVPPPTPSGWPSGILSSYEVFHVFFYGTDNRCLELQFGPYNNISLFNFLNNVYYFHILLSFKVTAITTLSFGSINRPALKI